MGQISLSIPQTGQPDATEEPKIVTDFTTIQTWANGNIDPSNLSATSGIMHLAYRNMTVSGSAVVGDWVVMSPSISVALPAPTANGLIALTTGAGVTGSAQVTVTGTNIWLPSAPSSVSSFTQGSPLTTLVLQSDGTSWITIAGRRDTGWVALTLGTNIAAVSGYYVPSARLEGATVYLRGAAQNNTGAGLNINYVMATVPTRPASTVLLPMVMGTNGVVGASVDFATGHVTPWVNVSVAAGAVFSFDGLSYPIS